MVGIPVSSLWAWECTTHNCLSLHLKGMKLPAGPLLGDAGVVTVKRAEMKSASPSGGKLTKSITYSPSAASLGTEKEIVKLPLLSTVVVVSSAPFSHCTPTSSPA